MMPILMDTYKVCDRFGRVDQEATYNNCAKHGFGLGLPHIYRGQFGRNEEYFICTADPKYFKGRYDSIYFCGFSFELGLQMDYSLRDVVEWRN